MKKIIYMTGLLVLLGACNSETKESVGSNNTNEEVKTENMTPEKEIKKELTLEEAINIDYRTIFLVGEIVHSAPTYYYGDATNFYDQQTATYADIADDLMRRLNPYMTKQYIESSYRNYISTHCVVCEEPLVPVPYANRAETVEVTIHNENEFTLHTTYEPKFMSQGGSFDVTYKKEEGLWKLHDSKFEEDPTVIEQPPIDSETEMPTYSENAQRIKEKIDAMIEYYYTRQESLFGKDFTHMANLREELSIDSEKYEALMLELEKEFQYVPLFKESQEIWRETLEHSLDILLEGGKEGSGVMVELIDHNNEQYINRIQIIFSEFGGKLN